MPARRAPEADDAVLEVAILDVKPGLSSEFESAFAQAESIIASAKGQVSHELRRCLETPDRYILLVRWESLEDHTKGFRESPRYQEWRRRLHHFYDPFPQVEHYVPLQHAPESGHRPSDRVSRAGKRPSTRPDA